MPSAGYVYVIADLRGIGHSEGIYEGLFSHHEGEDGHDMVEWLAKQPWCDGNVGLAGICYFSSMQLHTAAEQPPSLKCIAPWEIFGDDLYNHGQYEGGVFNIFLYGLYTGTYPARCGYAPNDVRSWMEMYTPADELKKIVDEAMADPDLKGYPYLLHLLQYPKKNPILFDFMLNKLDGPYYRERSVSERLDKINVPCYVGGPFFSFFSQPQMNVFNRVNTPKKMFLYTDMGTRPWRANHDELLRWYDYWLKGIETGIMDEPTIRYQTTGMTTWQAGETYPLETTQWTDFYFQSLEQLGAEPDYWNEEPDAFVQQPLYVTEKRNRVSYVSPPLPYDLQVTGPPRITFYADIDQDDTCWRVEVREADSDAIYPLASGWLRASHRALGRRPDDSMGDRARPHQGTCRSSRARSTSTWCSCGPCRTCSAPASRSRWRSPASTSPPTPRPTTSCGTSARAGRARTRSTATAATVPGRRCRSSRKKA